MRSSVIIRFQFVIWAGKSAREAIDAAMFETVGEA